MKTLLNIAASLTTVASLLTLSAKVAQAQFTTNYPQAQMQGLGIWETEAIFTVGETVEGYTPTGILDGIGAIKINNDTVRVVVNSEIAPVDSQGVPLGAPYTLNNGSLTVNGGARIHYFDIDVNNRTVKDAGLAFDRIFDRGGNLITDVSQFPSGASLSRFCSGQHFNAGSYGFVDNVYFAGEETSGGTQFVLDFDSIGSPQGGALYAAPALGRAAWENVTALEPVNADQIALLIGDDRSGAPLYLYLGEKNAVGDNSFLDRNGLAQGTLYVWQEGVNGDLSSNTFNGTGNSRTGNWVAVDNMGSDPNGFATQAELDARTAAVGAFQFSRPEDVSTNPLNGSQAVLASTGNGAFPNDIWGTTYIIDSDLANLTATVSILYDGDDAGNRDFGLRSPDNLDWADNGLIYVQEDRAISAFCQTSGEEASIWRINPTTGNSKRIAQMDRSVVVPAGVTDPAAANCGNWESSGILDVTELFTTKKGEKLFILDTQAHSLRDGVIGTQGLVEGGQLIFMSNSVPEPTSILGLLVVGGALGFGSHRRKD